MIHTSSLRISQEILGLIAEIDEFKGAWRALGMLPPERLSALRYLATVESIGSSTRIAGCILSDREVEALSARHKTKAFATVNEREVAGYAETLEFILRSSSEITITEQRIKQLHRDLLRYCNEEQHNRGEYKREPTDTSLLDDGGQAILFKAETPFATPWRMKEIVDWTRKAVESRELHPLLVIAIFVAVFLQIHPFQDGNGRLSRLLTTLLLLRAGYEFVPYISLDSFIEQNKKNYFLALQQTQSTISRQQPDWQPWVLYFLRALRQQTERLATKAKEEKIIQSALPELSLQILEHAHEHGRVSIGDMAAVTGKSRNTLKPHFRQLVVNGRLRLHGGGRGAWYSQP